MHLKLPGLGTVDHSAGFWDSLAGAGLVVALFAGIESRLGRLKTCLGQRFLGLEQTHPCVHVVVNGSLRGAYHGQQLNFRTLLLIFLRIIDHLVTRSTYLINQGMDEKEMNGWMLHADGWMIRESLHRCLYLVVSHPGL